MTQTFEELIENSFKQVAKNNNLGSTLVTGHRTTYFKEAMIIALQQVRIATLNQCAKITAADYTTNHSHTFRNLDKNSIEI